MHRTEQNSKTALQEEEVATLILTGLFTEGKEGLQKSNQLISNGLHPRMNQVTLTEAQFNLGRFLNHKNKEILSTHQ